MVHHSRVVIDKYKKDLSLIVQQLEFCEYTSDVHALEDNIAFIALKEMANESKAKEGQLTSHNKRKPTLKRSAVR